MKTYKLKQKFPNAIAVIDGLFVEYKMAFNATSNSIDELKKKYEYVGSGIIFSIDGVLQKTDSFYHFCK